MRTLVCLFALMIACLDLAPAAFAKEVIQLKNAKGESVGRAIVYNGMRGLRIQLNLKNLPPGEHAVHIHQFAVCDAKADKPREAFKSAGPAFNADVRKLGQKNPDEPFVGDLPNITVGPDGVANIQMDAPRAKLFGRWDGLWENGGAAIVIHANGDDTFSGRGGNAGDRIACGVVAKPADYRSSGGH
jgi:Cu-Zn family superoxide dismutase